MVRDVLAKPGEVALSLSRQELDQVIFACEGLMVTTQALEKIFRLRTQVTEQEAGEPEHEVVDRRHQCDVACQAQAECDHGGCDLAGGRIVGHCEADDQHRGERLGPHLDAIGVAVTRPPVGQRGHRGGDE